MEKITKRLRDAGSFRVASIADEPVTHEFPEGLFRALCDKIDDEYDRVTHESADLRKEIDKLNDVADIAIKNEIEAERKLNESLAGGKPMTEEDMLAEGWVRLPFGADGKFIRCGDEVTDGEHTFIVNSITVYGRGARGACDYRGHIWNASTLTHVVPDTWERIIEDATALGATVGRRTTLVDDLVARCKALAGDDQ